MYDREFFLAGKIGRRNDHYDNLSVRLDFLAVQKQRNIVGSVIFYIFFRSAEQLSYLGCGKEYLLDHQLGSHRQTTRDCHHCSVGGGSSQGQLRISDLLFFRVVSVSLRRDGLRDFCLRLFLRFGCFRFFFLRRLSVRRSSRLPGRDFFLGFCNCLDFLRNFRYSFVRAVSKGCHGKHT